MNTRKQECTKWKGLEENKFEGCDGKRFVKTEGKFVRKEVD